MGLCFRGACALPFGDRIVSIATSMVDRPP